MGCEGFFFWECRALVGGVYVARRRLRARSRDGYIARVSKSTGAQKFDFWHCFPFSVFNLPAFL